MTQESSRGGLATLADGVEDGHQSEGRKKERVYLAIQRRKKERVYLAIQEDSTNN